MAASSSSSAEISSKSAPPPPAAAAENESVETKVSRLNGEMERLLNVICEADEYSFESLQEAVNVMHRLKEYWRRLEIHRDTGIEIQPEFDVPELFKCPISHQLMDDPVVISNGETFDREYIEQWLSEGNRTSPISGEVILHTMLVPNILVGDMISPCETEFGGEPPEVVQDNGEFITEEDLAFVKAGHLNLNSIARAVAQCNLGAAKMLRGLVTTSMKTRANFFKFKYAINNMLQPIAPLSLRRCEYLRENLIITLYHLSRCDENKRLMIELSPSILILGDSLRCGSNVTIRYAAGTMFMLSKLDSNKLILGQSDTLKILLELLDEGNPWNMTIIGALVNRICTKKLVLQRVLGKGAIKLAVKKIKARILVEEMLEILSKLTALPHAREEMLRGDVKSCLKGLPLEFPHTLRVMNYYLKIDAALNDHPKNPSGSEQEPKPKPKPDQYTESPEQLIEKFCLGLSVLNI